MADLACLDCGVPIKGSISRFTGLPAVRCQGCSKRFGFTMRKTRRAEMIAGLGVEIAEVGVDEFCRRRYERETAPIELFEALGRAFTEPEQTLTERRLETLRLVAEGFTNSEIGKTLFVTEETVKTQIQSIYSVLGARNRAHAVHLGHLSGLLERQAA